MARLISLVEDESEGCQEALQSLYPYTGKAQVIAVTGPPGVGKSTLIGLMAERFASEAQSVGIVAVDPSSQISGGSLLGDRIHMSHVEFGKRVYL